MKKKQKRIMVVVLGVAAFGLCAVQLGPIFLGGKVVNPGKSTKQASDAPAGAATPAKVPGRRAAGATPKTGAKAGAVSAETKEPAFSLETVAIDLSAIGRRTLNYPSSGLRNPFAAALFEAKMSETSLTSMKLKLQGVIDSGVQRLAIIENRVYAQGDEVAPGVVLQTIEPNSVVLSDGKNEARLTMSAPNLKLGRPLK